jgi:hypothetical protein
MKLKCTMHSRAHAHTCTCTHVHMHTRAHAYIQTLVSSICVVCVYKGGRWAACTPKANPSSPRQNFSKVSTQCICHAKHTRALTLENFDKFVPQALERVRASDTNMAVGNNSQQLEQQGSRAEQVRPRV